MRFHSIISTVCAIGFGISLIPSLAHAQTPACFGQSIPMNTRAGTPFTWNAFSFGPQVATQSDPSANARLGYFLVDTGSNISHLDLSVSAPDAQGNRALPQTLNFFENIPFPESQWSDFSQFRLPFRQIGIIGTNVLEKNVYTFDFAHFQLFESSFAHACSDAQLSAMGFAALSTDGYYSTEAPGKELFPVEHVAPSQPNPNHYTIASIPTIPVRVGGTNAVAQIDTGYADSVYRFSVNINSAMLKAVNAQEAHLIPLRRIRVSQLKTCVNGVYETTTAYTLRAGDTFDWIAIDGSVARTYSNAIFFVKDTPPAAYACGGIGTWEIPAAQLGVSFIQEAGTMVLNADTQRVWVPRNTNH